MLNIFKPIGGRAFSFPVVDVIDNFQECLDWNDMNVHYTSKPPADRFSARS